jgi:hypothetical protein
MHRPNPFSIATLHHIPSLISRSPLRRGFPVVLLVLGLFALSPAVRAVDPPPDGGYPNGNTAEGDGALSSVQISSSTGFDNTAIGFDALHSDTIGHQNTANGFEALAGNTTGSSNTATGLQALVANTTGNENTATGVDALGSNTTGSSNTATGLLALAGNGTGSQNTATGVGALNVNSTGSNNTANGAGALQGNNADDNTATGAFALQNNLTGVENTATGFGALQNNRASNNTANGANALNANRNGSFNTANGAGALQNNAAGNNTANGADALFSNTTGRFNTATGANALFSNTTALNNTANGQSALSSNTTGGFNTAAGGNALHRNTTGGSNIALGFNAGGNLTTGSNNIDIGAVGVAGDAGKIRIGNQGTQNGTFIAGISGATVASGVGVIVGSNGQLGTVVSSGRFKEAIKPMDKASEAILALEPVTFRYKKELDPDGIPQFGLVAEQVEKANPDLVARNAEGKVYTVRYEAVNAMLLNEFLKEHRKVVNQETRLSAQEALIAQQQKQIETLAAGLQKVSAAVELNKAPPTQVADNR